MKALEGAVLGRVFFMMNQTARAASRPRPTRPPTTPPAMAPASELPPPLEFPEVPEVFIGVTLPILVPVLLEPVEVERVTTEGPTPEASGWSKEDATVGEWDTPRR